MKGLNKVNGEEWHRETHDNSSELRKLGVV